MRQSIRFCTAPDGVRIAYATSGAGPPLVKTGNWLTHLEFDWESPIWRHMFHELSSDHLLVRYDDRGNGLSDWDAKDISFEAWVRDLETVVDAVGLDRFVLFGLSRGGAVSIEYAARHPDRVSHLILLGAYYRGASLRSSGKEEEIRQAMLTLMRVGWGQDNPAFHQLWTSCFVPDGTLEHQRWFNELQRMTTSPENAVRMQKASASIDVSHRLGELRMPTLVCHSRGDAVISFAHGRRLAASIPNARFISLESRNHLLLEHEPAFDVFVSEVRQFLGTPARERTPVAADLGPEAPLSPGSHLGHFRLSAPIGKGGMGVVYRAKDTKLGRDVALKVLALPSADRDQGRRWLLREARHAAVLSHPNICTVFDVVHVGGRDLIVMELVTGQTLSARLADGPLPLDKLCSWGAQIADALDHAHRRGVIHGDLKAGNVIVTEEERVKVLDFGVSRRLLMEGRDTITEMSLASEGMIGGTPAYMAPELLRGHTTDTRSDIWSLGVLLFEAATGRLPFAGNNLYDLMQEILEKDAVWPPGCVEAPLRAVIQRCMQKAPENRYQYGCEARDALLAIAGSARVPQT